MKINRFFLLLVLWFTGYSIADTYTVQSGDTLSKIALAELGESARWKEIAELNNLKEPYTLKISQQLEMPSDYLKPVSNEERTDTVAAKEKQSRLKNLMFFCSLLSIPLMAVIGIWLVFSLFSCLLFAAGYKRACKIFKIETTFGKSFLAAICLSGIGTVASFILPCTETDCPPPSYFIVYAAVALLAIIVCLIFLRYFFRCNWPQSIGVYVVGGLIGFLWHFLIVFLISLPLWIIFLTHRSEMI